MNRLTKLYNRLDSISDNALMLKVRDGDLDKLGLLFERYYRRLFGFFYRLTHRHDISEDLVQAVFERILKYRESYNDDGAFSTWIFQIARNLHIDYYRKNSKKQIQEEFDWETLEDDDSEIVQKTEEERKRLLLQQALEQLDTEKKQTLILSRYEGFKYREIAEIMGCTESAVKVRVFRGIYELKEIVNDLRKQEEL